MRYKIILSYDGSTFCGWQIQPGNPSVQGTVEQVLSVLLRQDIRLVGAGRTDTGVNASRYVAHFDCIPPGLGDPGLVLYKMNAMLPRSICVSSVEAVPDDFHARFDAVRREYRYFLHRSKDPFVDSFSYLYAYPELDFSMMNQAASALPGRHDFSCFEKLGSDNGTSVCTVYSAVWKQYEPAVCAYPGEGKYWYFEIAADRFLRNMVRAVAGTLLETGRGRRSVQDFASLVLPADGPAPDGICRRCLAGESVPGHALFLNRIEY